MEKKNDFWDNVIYSQTEEERVKKTQIKEPVKLSTKDSTFTVTLKTELSWGAKFKIPQWINLPLIRTVIHSPKGESINETIFSLFDLVSNNPTNGQNRGFEDKDIILGPFPINETGNYYIYIEGICILKFMNGSFLTLTTEGRIETENQLIAVHTVCSTGWAPENTHGQAFYVNKK